ncbi:hypothetical protein DF156_27005 [Burkholderia ubonensis]|nr:hypothetical protein CJO69_15500 [Burkholderia ubonensis]RQP28931.1 hypothetical protein DF155_26205 [Burkholderia ubonensis]RQP31858.1 hypothetical protein DF154_28465 [Burkholderia ubonensis]RQP34365.1 hypothetical protein DF156_27005 [Burkholderia ubonensis]RQP49409.1 hypothetical protein DF144_25160 [Burkholderia ubonensis]
MLQEVLLNDLAEVREFLYRFFDVTSKQDFNGVALRHLHRSVQGRFVQKQESGRRRVTACQACW